MKKTLILTYHEMKRARDATEEQLLNTITEPKEYCIDKITGSAIAIIGGIVFKSLGKFIPEFQIVGALAFSSDMLDDLKKSQQKRYYNIYKKICDVMEDDDFRAVKLEGHFYTRDGFSIINGYPKAVGFRTKSGRWLTEE